MAMYAGDGTRHHSASRARMHDMTAAKPAAKPSMGGDKPAAGADAGGDMGGDVSSMPIKDVVAKHGPAHKVVMEHNHAAGSHKKTSHHGKHTHTSEHESADEAHKHGMMAAGVETPGEEDETPNEANEDLSGENESNEPEHAGVPGIG